MTDERMALIELVEKQADGDLVRDMLAFAAERIMGVDLTTQRDVGWTTMEWQLPPTELQRRLRVPPAHSGLRLRVP